MGLALEEAVLFVWMKEVPRFRVDKLSLPPFLQHDELADSLPCAEGEFIFIRLSVLREVCGGDRWHGCTNNKPTAI